MNNEVVYQVCGELVEGFRVEAPYTLHLHAIQDNYSIRAGKTVILQHDFLGDPSHAMRSDEDSLRRLVSDNGNGNVNDNDSDSILLMPTLTIA